MRTCGIPEKNCSTACADKVPKGGRPNVDHQDLRSSKADLNERADRVTSEKYVNGEPKGTTSKGNEITVDIDLEMSVSAPSHAMRHLHATTAGRHTGPQRTETKALGHVGTRVCNRTPINIGINPNMEELYGIGIGVSELKMSVCGIRTAGSAELQWRTVSAGTLAFRLLGGRVSTERSFIGPSAHPREEMAEELDPLAATDMTEDEAIGDLNTETTTLYGLARWWMVRCAMAMMEDAMGGTRTNSIEAPAVPVEAQRPPQTGSSSSASWPLRGDDPAGRILRGAADGQEVTVK